MSTMTRDQQQIFLPKTGPDEFTDAALEALPGDYQRRHKLVAMLDLRYASGWSYERIGYAFSHHKGHVLRMIRLAMAALSTACVPTPRP